MKSKVKIPRGWRLVNRGEIFLKSDKYLDPSIRKFVPLLIEGHKCAAIYGLVIRRVTPRKPVNPLAEIAALIFAGKAELTADERKYYAKKAAAFAREVRRRDRMK